MELLIRNVTLENGQSFVNVPANLKQLLELGVTSEQAESIMLQADTFTKKLEIKEAHRVEIEALAGDTESILGTTADGMQILFHAFSAFIVKLSSAQSLEEMRATTNDFVPIAQSFLTKVESAEIKLPFNVRGLNETMAKIEKRSTAVANVLASA